TVTLKRKFMAEPRERNDAIVSSPLQGHLMGPRLGRLFGLAAIALSLAAKASADTKDFVVDLKPVFQSASVSSAPSPVALSIANKGTDAKGQIVVSNGYNFTRYPVDLPRGAKKRVITYPTSTNNYGGQLEFTLETDQGEMKLPYIGGTGGGYGGSYSVA